MFGLLILFTGSTFGIGPGPPNNFSRTDPYLLGGGGGWGGLYNQNPPLERIWGIWGSYHNIPKAIFYLLKGDYIYIYAPILKTVHP